MNSPNSLHSDPAVLSLALAVIASSNEPLVLLDDRLTVIGASSSFCRAFMIEPATVVSRHFAELGLGEWNTPQLISLLEATASGAAEVHAYELTLERPGQDQKLLVLNANRLVYDDDSQTRILLAIADVTEARASDKVKDNLLRDKDNLLLEKAVLLQEVQHRIANSLQIIASILMQSARQVQSDETRGHLRNAHGRLMSIAAVQSQLSKSSRGEVDLHPYLTQLCKSLGASMINDPELLSIEVHVDKDKTDSDVSMSLGLIVTELVINALKHGFPGNRKGKIVVTYKSQGQDWTLGVSDDGVGMPKIATDAKAGLGTNIVESLAKRLEAEVRVTDANPGTAVLIVHSQAMVTPVGKAA